MVHRQALLETSSQALDNIVKRGSLASRIEGVNFSETNDLHDISIEVVLEDEDKGLKLGECLGSENLVMEGIKSILDLEEDYELELLINHFVPETEASFSEEKIINQKGGSLDEEELRRELIEDLAHDYWKEARLKDMHITFMLRSDKLLCDDYVGSIYCDNSMHWTIDFI